MKISKNSWVSVGLLLVIIGAVASGTVFATTLSKNTDDNSDKIESVEKINEKEHEEFRKNQQAANDAIIGINSKLEILVKGYKK